MRTAIHGLLLLVIALLTGCSSSEPQPVKTVYVTQTPSATTGNSGAVVPQQPQDGTAYLNCVNQANQILMQANQLRDQAMQMSLDAGFGADSNQALASTARSLEQQSTQLVFQYQNMLRSCDSLR